MNTRNRIATVVTACVLGVGGAFSVAAASGGDDGDQTVTGADADRATEAALGYTHGGRANAVERDSENGATWEVEVTKTDGSTVDVRLDAQFHLVVIEGDSENG
jgi:uncharacterized membrane protein YkoI